MKNETLYNKTVDILVQAYFNDTLEHGQCTACAVGNIIKANNGCNDYQWYSIIQGFMLDKYDLEIGENAIKSTGYSLLEIRNIEKSFEGVNKHSKDAMFNGLMAVIDCLDKIHENTDTQVTEQSKKRFDKTLCHA